MIRSKRKYLASIIALALVGSSLIPSSGRTVPAIEPEILDANGELVIEVFAGQKLFIRPPFLELKIEEGDYVSIMQVKDQNGFTTHLSALGGHLEKDKSLKRTHIWAPDATGNFNMEFFVWTDLEEPVPIAPVIITSVPVFPLVKIPKGSSDSEQQNFNPNVIKVVLGVNNTVVWLNEDSVPQRVLSYAPFGFDSGAIEPDQTWRHTFTKAGVYDFHSDRSSWMKGAVIVQSTDSIIITFEGLKSNYRVDETMEFRTRIFGFGLSCGEFHTFLYSIDENGNKEQLYGKIEFSHCPAGIKNHLYEIKMPTLESVTFTVDSPGRYLIEAKFKDYGSLIESTASREVIVLEPIDLQSLRSKPISAVIHRFAAPQEECFRIDDQMLQKYIALEEGIKRADEETAGPIYVDRYAGRSVEFSREAALSIIKEIPFKHSVTKHQVDSIQDETHTFQCTIQYGNRFYDLQIEFSGFNPSPEEGFAVVKIFQEGSRVVLKPAHATIWATFNNTVVWNNELSHKIAIISQGNSPVKRFDEFATESNIVMPRNIWYFTFIPDWTKFTDETYRYRVEPYGLEGAVLLKMYPQCMTEEIVKSLYSQTKLEVNFPTYLPDGYKYQCGIHLLSTAVILTYWNKDWTEDPHAVSGSEAGLGKGVITITAIREFQERDEQKVAEEHYNEIKGLPPLDPAFLSINGNPAVALRQYMASEQGTVSIRILWLYLDQQTYIFKGKSLIELFKMAQSLG